MYRHPLEYLGNAHNPKTMADRSVCVFCGSSFGTDPIYRSMAEETGRYLAKKGLRVVYGGGNIGLMGVLADATLGAGGKVVGVIPQHLVEMEVAHAGLTEIHVVASMHERKALMADLSSSFIALPGGFGTFDELCEILTWGQLGLHHKPMGILNVKGYFDPFLALLDTAVKEGFLRPEHRAIVQVATTLPEISERFAAYKPVDIEKWVGPLRR